MHDEVRRLRSHAPAGVFRDHVRPLLDVPDEAAVLWQPPQRAQRGANVRIRPAPAPRQAAQLMREEGVVLGLAAVARSAGKTT